MVHTAPLDPRDRALDIAKAIALQETGCVCPWHWCHIPQTTQAAQCHGKAGMFRKAYQATFHRSHNRLIASTNQTPTLTLRGHLSNRRCASCCRVSNHCRVALRQGPVPRGMCSILQSETLCRTTAFASTAEEHVQHMVLALVLAKLHNGSYAEPRGFCIPALQAL